MEVGRFLDLAIAMTAAVDYQRRAEKASYVPAARVSTRSAASAEREWRT
jgi:hypothetical protein